MNAATAEAVDTSQRSLRNLKIYMSAQVLDLHGLWIHRVALGWVTWVETESEFWVGMIAFAQFIPVVFLGPLFGVLADRLDRRYCAIVLNLTLTAIATVMVVASFAGWLDIWVILALSLLQGIAAGAYSPIRMSLVANLLAMEHLARGIAINSLAFNASRFLGPMFAGLIIVTWNVSWAFVINAVSYFFMLLALLAVQPLTRREAGGERREVLDELLEGLRYVLDHELIRSMLYLAITVSIFGRGVLELLPAFADGVFGRGAVGLAWLTSASGAGAIVAGLWLARRGGRPLKMIAPLSAAVSGLVVIAFALNQSFEVGLVLTACLGFFFSTFGITVQSLLQTQVDDAFRGRVSSFWGVFGIGGSALGAFLLGALAPQLGLSVVSVISGVVCIALCFPVSARILRRIR
ncbi:MAG: MFS transporter [Pseudomonadota bacterium]